MGTMRGRHPGFEAKAAEMAVKKLHPRLVVRLAVFQSFIEQFIERGIQTVDRGDGRGEGNRMLGLRLQVGRQVKVEGTRRHGGDPLLTPWGDQNEGGAGK